jgi:hypothetical protein
MSGRAKHDRDTVDGDRLAVDERLKARPSSSITKASRHDRERLRGGEHGPVARPRMVAVAVGDHRPIDRAAWVDEEATRLA